MLKEKYPKLSPVYIMQMLFLAHNIRWGSDSVGKLDKNLDDVGFICFTKHRSAFDKHGETIELVDLYVMKGKARAVNAFF
jgi:hypothetical protein